MPQEARETPQAPGVTPSLSPQGLGATQAGGQYQYKVYRYTIVRNEYVYGYDMLRAVYKLEDEKTEYTDEIPQDVVEKLKVIEELKGYNTIYEYPRVPDVIMTVDDAEQTLNITIVVDLFGADIDESEIDDIINEFIDGILEKGYNMVSLFTKFVDLAKSIRKPDLVESVAAYMHGGNFFGEVKMVVAYFG